jgi:hypothetical protein
MQANRMSWTGATLVGLALTASACSENAAPAVSSLERDSAGVVIVENTPPFPEWGVGEEPEARIGVVAGGPAYQFYDVRFAGRLSDGRIVVADAGAMEIRWYGASGEHRSSVGRRGEAPGEFRGFGSVILTAGDTLIVHDEWNQRLTWLSPEESIVRDRPLLVERYGVRLLGVRGPGRIVIGETSAAINIGGSEFNYARDTLLITIRAPEMTDTVGSFPGSEAATWVRYANGRPVRTMQMDLPFGYVVLAAALGQHIVVGDGEQYQLAFYDEAGQLSRLSRRADVVPRVVSEEDRERFVEYRAEEARAGKRDEAVARKSAQDRLVLLPEGHSVPPFDHFLVDTEDNLWVRDYMLSRPADQAQQWTVYDNRGHVAGRVMTPAGLNVMSISRNHVVGVMRDELDVEYIAVYALTRR